MSTKTIDQRVGPFSYLHYFLYLAVSLYLLLALFSFSLNDPSILASNYPQLMPLHNICGLIGSQVAGWLIWQFGVLSFSIPLLLTFERTLHLRKHSFSFYWVYILLLGFTASILLVENFAYHFEIEGFTLASTGAFGQELYNVITKYLGNTGPWVFIGMIALSTCAPLLSKTTYIMKKIRNIPIKIPKTNAFTKIKKQMKDFREIKPIEKDQESPIAFIPEDNLDDVEEFIENENPISEEPTDIDTTDSSFIPPTEVFNRSKNNTTNEQDNQQETKDLLLQTLADFGVKGEIINVQNGPVVAVYEFQPVAGTKQSKVIGLADDLALSLKVDSLLINPVSGKRALGIEVPNDNRELVYFGDLLTSRQFKQSKDPLTYALGKSISGETLCLDITKMPHLLMAGATGSGKSVAVNAIICSVLMKATPAEVRMILVDPKMLELSVYEEIPHLLLPVITDPGEAATSLKWAVNEMEKRYKLMQKTKVRSIAGYNQFIDKMSQYEKETFLEENELEEIEPLPYILIVIDELADLMLTAPKDVECQIQRLAQKARASGIHLVLATQRPSVDIITGVIKANLPCRAAFQVVSKHDSRTILDQPGADKLLGKGDMLLQRPGFFKLLRAQSAFISDEEVNDLVAQIKRKHKTNYDATLMDWIETNNVTQADGSPSDDDDDVKYTEAVDLAQSNGHVSASFLQRHLKIGYNRAARIVEAMEKRGLVGKSEGSKPRPWLG